jgi:hypothetical protein
VPPGLVSGYGVEKISGNPVRARQAAYLKAMDDLLTRSGPVLVSKTVQDQTTVVDIRPANRVLESTFRLRASRILQPSFERNGVDHGFMWVLLASTEEDIERGWQQFVAWRMDRIDQAQKLFQEAKGSERVQLLKASPFHKTRDSTLLRIRPGYARSTTSKPASVMNKHAKSTVTTASPIKYKAPAARRLVINGADKEALLNWLEENSSFADLENVGLLLCEIRNHFSLRNPLAEDLHSWRKKLAEEWLSDKHFGNRPKNW